MIQFSEYFDMLIGYACVSTQNQNPQLQLNALGRIGILRRIT